MRVNVTCVARWMKIAGALMLLSCYALPMSSCTHHYHAPTVEKASKDVAASGPQTVVRQPLPTKEYHYLLPVRHPQYLSDWLLRLSFVIPALVVFGANRWPDRLPMRAIWHVEPLCLAWVFVALINIVMLETLEIGSYVALAGMAVYSAGWHGEAITKVRARKMSWRALNISWAASFVSAALITSWMLYLMKDEGLVPPVTIACGAILWVYLFVVFALGVNWLTTRRNAVR